MTTPPKWNELIPELKAAWAFAWASTKSHYKSLIPASLLYGATLFAGDLSSFFVDKKDEVYFLIALSGAILGMAFNIGLIRIGFDLQEKVKVNTWLLFGYGRFILPLIALNLLLGGPVLILSLWLISAIPYAAPLAFLVAVHFLVRLSLFSYFLAEEGPKSLSIFKTCKALAASLLESFRSTKGWSLYLSVVIISEFAALLLGAALLGIGLIWAVPFSLFANIFVYRRICKQNLVG